MRFINSHDSIIGEVDLAEAIRTALFADHKVVWLLSGGSNIPTATTIMQQLAGAPLEKLIIMLGDERFGQTGHANSNAEQLKEAGFDSGTAKFIPILANEDLATTTNDFAKAFIKSTDNADDVIFLAGIGWGGHIAGILPESEAVDSNEIAIYYHASDFTRITLTPKALKKVTATYVFARGESKRSELLKLRDKDVPINQQPAQLLKQLPEVYVYNDQIGERI